MKRTSNIDVKKLNRNRVFRLINRYERLSRPEIAVALGMSGPTVLLITNELLEKGLIREEGEFESTGGRKAKALSPIHNALYAVGLDITQNHIGLVLTNLSGVVLRHIRLQNPFENTKVYRTGMAKQLMEFIGETGINQEKLLGVGISIPGIIDSEKKQITYSHALNMFNVDCGEFSHIIPLKTAFINDANAAAIAELGAMEEDNALYLSLSNSVGGAIISRKDLTLGENRNAGIWQSGSLYMGSNFKGGEIGHMTLVPGGKPCYCGQKGCFDAYCSAKNLARHTDGKLEYFFQGLADEDPRFRSEWDKYLDHLAVHINSLRMLMDCTMIVGGYVGAFIEPYLDDLRQRLARLNTFGEKGSYLRACKYRLEASALGAALLHVEAYINTI